MIQDLKLKDVQPGENYRRHMDKNGMKELTASVKAHGVLQPIIVRKIKKGYEVIAGHRRHQAALDAGLKTIPASIVTADDAAALEIAVIENTQREDPNPMDEALGFKRLLDLGKHTVATLAGKLDKSQAYIYTRLRLNELSKDAQKALLSGRIDIGHAQVLMRLPEKKDQAELLADILDQDMSVLQAREHLDEYGVEMERAIFNIEKCHGCHSRSITQTKLFADADPAGDRCMDAACFNRKMMEHLDRFSGSEIVKGRTIFRDNAVQIDSLQRRGVIIHLSQDLKPKCKPCMERAFFFAEINGVVRYGWHCPSRKCHDEVWYGIKPQPKKTTSEKKEEQGPDQQPGQEAGSPERLPKIIVPGMVDESDICCPACGEKFTVAGPV